MNLVQSLGSGYFNEFFNGSVFMYEGRVHQIVECRASGVRCTRLHDGEPVVVPNNFFMGFKVFNYPTLGYRRISEHIAAFLTRNQSVRRGLNPQHVRHQNSPISQRLLNEGHINSTVPPNNGLLVYEPVFDSPEAVQQLLAGDRANVVLNEEILIEPSVNSDNDWYTIYHNQAIVGSMDYRGRTSFINPKYDNIITPLLR